MQPRKHIRFDWAIKRLLRQKANFGILEGFLSELLKEDIQIVEILDSESNKETEQDKFNRVDILVKDQKGDLIIIEVQNSYALDYFLRILYGISKAITEHLKEGDVYAKVKKVISVNIIYFDLGQGSDYIYKGTTTFRGIHDYQLLELTTAQKNLFRKEKVEEVFPETYLIKVNNFDDHANDTLDEWIYFLKNSEIKQEFSAKGLQKANEILQVANMPDPDRRDYKRFVEVLSDRASVAFTIEFEANLRAEVLAEEKAEILAEAKAEILAEAKAEILAEAKAEILAEAKAVVLAEAKAVVLAEAKAEILAEAKAVVLAEAKAEILAEAKAEVMFKEKMEQEKVTIVLNLLRLQTLTEDQIAATASVTVEFVRKVKGEMDEGV